MEENNRQKIISRYVKQPEWRVMSRRADFGAIARQFGVDPVVARVMVNRGVTEAADMDMYLNGDMNVQHDPARMKDLPEGCRIIYGKLKAGSHVRIISDYDVDGVVSAYILYIGMRKVWAQLHEKGADECTCVDYDIPHRVHDGYGINKRLIDAAHDAGADTIITCDNGIAAYNQTEYAKKLGMTVIITDHHQVPYMEDGDGTRTYMLPPADAVIDPQRADCEYPFKGICGAGVVYKFIRYLYRMAGISESATDEFVELLGLATNCDMMELVDENRIFVRRALERIADSANPGIAALMRQAGRAGRKAGTFDLGFLIGPCINAAGRLGDAKTSLALLLERDPQKAEERARELLETNEERKGMTESGAAQIRRMLEENTLRYAAATEAGECAAATAQDGAERSAEQAAAAMQGRAESGMDGVTAVQGEATLADTVIVAYIPKVHESVVGIMASRLKELYSRPVMVFTDSENPDILKGSGRSIEQYDMFAELNRFRDMFTAFGGHAMAAGFSIRRERLGELRRLLNENSRLTDDDITPRLMIDVPMPLSYNSVELTEQLERLEPYGKGNRRPLFAERNVPVVRAQVVGKNRNCLRLTFRMDNGRYITGISFEPDKFIDYIKQWFGTDECDRMLKGQPSRVIIDVAYYPQINEYRGMREVQVRVVEIAMGGK